MIIYTVQKGIPLSRSPFPELMNDDKALHQLFEGQSFYIPTTNHPYGICGRIKNYQTPELNVVHLSEVQQAPEDDNPKLAALCHAFIIFGKERTAEDGLVKLLIAFYTERGYATNCPPRLGEKLRAFVGEVGKQLGDQAP